MVKHRKWFSEMYHQQQPHGQGPPQQVPMYQHQQFQAGGQYVENMQNNQVNLPPRVEVQPMQQNWG